jgi:hypothetical protein
MYINKNLPPDHRNELISILKKRFNQNMTRHENHVWTEVKARLELPGTDDKLRSLHEMEQTGGEPDVVGYDKNTGEFIFYDCSAESPKGAAASVTILKRSSPGKSTNPKIVQLAWQPKWGLNC